MASPKALAAIALTLIIAAPICLGFAMASENTTYTEWQTESNSNLSNQILNYETPIYSTYDGPNNNLYLQDISGTPPTYDRLVPSYNQVSANATSLPEYTTTLDTLTLAASTNGTYTLSNTSVGSPGSGATNILAAKAITKVEAPLGSNLTLTYTDQVLQRDVPLPDGMLMEATYLDGLYHLSIYDYEIDETIDIPNVIKWSFTSSSATVYTLLRDYTTISIASDYSLVYAGAAAVKITHSDSTVEYFTQTSEEYSTFAFNSPRFFHISTNGDNLLYQDVTSVAIAAVRPTLTYTEVVQTSDYAVTSEGWQLPASSVMWYNNFLNEAVRMMVKLDNGESLSITVPGSGTAVTLSKSLGTISVNGSSLGAYTSMMVEIGMKETTVYGISSWPGMGQYPSTLNTITVAYSSPLTEPFEEIQLTKTNNPDIRIDLASVAMGSFPSTKDYTLNMSGLFPNKSYTAKLNSIGIYGDTLTVGTHAYTVTNGRISIDGETVALKGTTISSRWNGSSYDLYVASHKIGTSSAPASITFGGEWSLTVTAQILKQVTGEKAEWAPGSFAFDEDSFKGVIVLAAALTFIGVGMYGARSGVKIGLLLMICGGAALIAMITL